MPNTYADPPELAAGSLGSFSRADLVFEDVDHSDASFEARIFLNNVDADENTPKTANAGYAGSFHIFGHGGCYGDDMGHCVVRPWRAYDPRPAHHLNATRKVVIVTTPLRRALSQSSTVKVNIVVVVTGTTPNSSPGDPLSYKKMSIVTYR